MISYSCWWADGKKGKWIYDQDEFSKDIVICGDQVMTMDIFWQNHAASIIKLWEERL